MSPKVLWAKNLSTSTLKTTLKTEENTENYYSLPPILKNTFQVLLCSPSLLPKKPKKENNSSKFYPIEVLFRVSKSIKESRTSTLKMNLSPKV